MSCAGLFHVKAQHNLVVKPLGNMSVPNSPATAPHHISERLYSAYVLFIHD